MRETKFIIDGTVLLVLVLGLFTAVLGITDTKTVSTESGQLRGLLYRTIFDDKPYYAFRGIPYAKPPLGELRFKVSLLRRKE